MEATTDLSIFYMKRMLRNLKYLFPEDMNDIDAYTIKKELMTSKVKNSSGSGTQEIHMGGMEASNLAGISELRSKIDEVDSGAEGDEEAGEGGEGVEGEGNEDGGEQGQDAEEGEEQTAAKSKISGGKSSRNEKSKLSSRRSKKSKKSKK